MRSAYFSRATPPALAATLACLAAVLACMAGACTQANVPESGRAPAATSARLPDPPSPCARLLRTALSKAASPLVAIHRAAKGFLLKEGHAQSRQIERILDEQKQIAKIQGMEFDEYVRKSWLPRVQSRMETNIDYPTLDEVLAVMTTQSPTFKMTMSEFQQNRGAFKQKLLFHLREDSAVVRIPKGTARRVASKGTRLWEAWRDFIRVPARKTDSPQKFATFMVELEDAMFRSMHDDPGYFSTVIGAVSKPVRDKLRRGDTETWNVMKIFAERVQRDFREPHRLALESVMRESIGHPRPEVIQEFLRYGVLDTVYRRLALPLKGKNPLTLNENLIRSREVEKLSQEVRFFAGFAVAATGIFVAHQALDRAEAARDDALKSLRERACQRLKEEPETADDLRRLIREAEKRIRFLESESARLQAELAKNPAKRGEIEEQLGLIELDLTARRDEIREANVLLATPDPCKEFGQ